MNADSSARHAVRAFSFCSTKAWKSSSAPWIRPHTTSSRCSRFGRSVESTGFHPFRGLTCTSETLPRFRALASKAACGASCAFRSRAATRTFHPIKPYSLSGAKFRHFGLHRLGSANCRPSRRFSRSALRAAACGQVSRSRSPLARRSFVVLQVGARLDVPSGKVKIVHSGSAAVRDRATIALGKCSA